jgi:hypothetical protein
MRDLRLLSDGLRFGTPRDEKGELAPGNATTDVGIIPASPGGRRLADREVPVAIERHAVVSLLHGLAVVTWVTACILAWRFLI